MIVSSEVVSITQQAKYGRVCICLQWFDIENTLLYDSNYYQYFIIFWVRKYRLKQRFCNKIGKLFLNHKPWAKSFENIKSMFDICFDCSLQIQRYVERMILMIKNLSRRFIMDLGTVSFTNHSVQRLETQKILDRKFQMATKFLSSSKRIQILISFKTRLILNIWTHELKRSLSIFLYVLK